MQNNLRKTWATLSLVLLSAAAHAAGGPLGIDHRLPFDESGIWSRNTQLGVTYVSAATVLGGALYLGEGSRLGKTFLRATDSMVIAAVSSAGLKALTQRPRPRTRNDPGVWRQGAGNQSFPSGEVAHITAVVTPFIAEYRNDEPAVWALATLPVYVGVARMKSQAHWQTDVLAGIALGVATGLYAQSRSRSWTAEVFGGTLGIRYTKSF